MFALLFTFFWFVIYYGQTFSIAEYDLCPCFVLPESFKSAIGAMLDVSLLKDPVFMLIGISNIFGMAGLYVPFVYLVDAATINVSNWWDCTYVLTKTFPIITSLQGIDPGRASFLISIIGITNTFGRVFCGYIADFPKVNSLLLNNICLVISTIAVAATPFCKSYASYVIVAIAFGLAVGEFFYEHFISLHFTFNATNILFPSNSWLYFINVNYPG